MAGVPESQVRTAAPSQPLKIRIRTWLHRYKVDRELAAGADPNLDPLRRARACELVRESTRHKIADSLERVLRRADSAPQARSSQAPIARGPIRASRSDLETIVERLKAPATVSPQGVAKAVLLLTECTGPLYDGSEQELARASHAAVQAIDRGPGLAA